MSIFCTNAVEVSHGIWCCFCSVEVAQEKLLSTFSHFGLLSSFWRVLFDHTKTEALTQKTP